MACFYHALKTQENGKTESGFNLNGVIKDRGGREKMDRGISDKAAPNKNRGYQA
jgi:hypothetical protein